MISPNMMPQDSTSFSQRPGDQAAAEEVGLPRDSFKKSPHLQPDLQTKTDVFRGV